MCLLGSNADWSDTLDFSDFTGIPNNSGSGKTGDICLPLSV